MFAESNTIFECDKRISIEDSVNLTPKHLFQVFQSQGSPPPVPPITNYRPLRCSVAPYRRHNGIPLVLKLGGGDDSSLIALACRSITNLIRSALTYTNSTPVQQNCAFLTYTLPHSQYEQSPVPLTTTKCYRIHAQCEN